MKKFIAVILMANLFTFGIAGNGPADADKDAAAYFMQNNQYDAAVYWLETEYKKAPSPALAMRLGEAYTLLKKYSKALSWFDKAGDLNDVATGRYLLFKGDALLGDKQYDKARETYNLYAAITGSSKDIVGRMENIRKLLTAMEDSSKWVIGNLPFNSIDDEMIVTNFRTKELMISNHHAPAGVDKSTYFDFFTLEREYDKWLAPKRLMKPEDETHNRPGISFSRDGNKVYFVQTDKGTSKLYEANILGNKFLEIKNLPLIPAGSQVKDPYISPSGTLLYFASNMPGGYGGYDIYVSANTNGTWSKPQNLGLAVNSEDDELAPYYRVYEGRHELYFSSRRATGFGGLDIYFSPIEGNRYAVAKILSPPLNSPEDERCIMFDDNKNNGYLTSNRAGGKGGFDVFHFRAFSLTVATTVVNAKGEPIPYAVARVGNNEALTNNKGVAYLTLAPDKVYNMEVKASKYLPGAKEVQTAGARNNDTLSYRVVLDPKPVGQPVEESYVDMFIQVKDANNKVMPKYILTIINLQNSKTKKIQADANGLISQALMPGNDYRIISHDPSFTLSEKISTKSLTSGAAIQYELVLSGNSYSFKKM